MYTDQRAPQFTFDFRHMDVTHTLMTKVRKRFLLARSETTAPPPARQHPDPLPLCFVFEAFTDDHGRLASIQQCIDFRSARGPAPEIPIDALVFRCRYLTDSGIAAIQDMIRAMSAKPLRAIECLEVGGVRSPVKTLELLKTVLDVSTSMSSLTRVWFAQSHLLDSHMACLCSHLRYSCSLHEIEFDTMAGQTLADAEQSWRWIAFALFSPWPVARASDAFQLRKITLSRQKLSLSRVEAFKRTLQDPAELAGGATPWRAPDGATREVIPRRCLVEQRVTAFAAASTSADPVATIEAMRVLEVVYSQAQWVCAVYPGVGLAWILSKHVTMLSRGTQSGSAAVQRHSSYDLALSTYESDVSALNALLTSVGRHVCGLTLSYYSRRIVLMPTMVLVLDGIMTQCPFLEHLDLSSWYFEDAAVDALVDALRGALGSRLRSLDLVSMYMPRGNNFICEIATILADTQRICTLRELRIHSRLETRTIERLSNALRINLTLEVLELDHAPLRDDPAGHASVQRLQAVFHGQVLQAALPRASKRAFLSVLATPRSLPLSPPGTRASSGLASARHAIDAVMAAAVFSHFAPRDVRRHVLLVQ